MEVLEINTYDKITIKEEVQEPPKISFSRTSNSTEFWLGGKVRDWVMAVPGQNTGLRPLFKKEKELNDKKRKGEPFSRVI